MVVVAAGGASRETDAPGLPRLGTEQGNAASHPALRDQTPRPVQQA
jgi:hypothetical protein